MEPDNTLCRTAAAIFLASLILAPLGFFGPALLKIPLQALGLWQEEVKLTILGFGGVFLYGSAFWLFFSLFRIRFGNLI
jgi:putative peptidoglycan lipid II flippase